MGGIEFTDIRDAVAEYYDTKLSKFGPEPRGVDWKDEESQNLRFRELCRIIRTEGHFSLNDIGCGYGAFGSFLAERYRNFKYIGVDISQAMIKEGRLRLGEGPKYSFHHCAEPPAEADYGVASGIFNVKLDTDVARWIDYIHETLDVLYATSRRGFAFNCLTSYADECKKRPDLFYADPAVLLDYCANRFSRHVAVFQDYGLYEFTVLVRRVL